MNLSVTYQVALKENPMALDKDALSDLLEALRAGGDLDVVRSGMQLVLQALIDLEAAEAIGAGRYERSAERVTHRNGARERLLSTKAGELELQIPKLRHGAFFPSLLEPRRRIERALWAVVMEAYVHGVSRARSTIWSRRSASTPGSQSPRSRASAGSSMSRSGSFAIARSATAPSRTCSWMRPT